MATLKLLPAGRTSLTVRLADVSEINAVPVQGSVPAWNAGTGKLDITSATTNLTITDGGNF
jgi:hypothetical protein